MLQNDQKRSRTRIAGFPNSFYRFGRFQRGSEAGTAAAAVGNGVVVLKSVPEEAPPLPLVIGVQGNWHFSA